MPEKKTAAAQGERITVEIRVADSVLARAHAGADALLAADPESRRTDERLNAELKSILSMYCEPGESLQERQCALLARQRDDWELVRMLALTAARAGDVAGARAARHAAEALVHAHTGLRTTLGPS